MTRILARGSAWFTGADEAGVDYYDLVYGRDFEADGVVEAVQVRHGDMSPDGSGPLSFERGVEIGQVFLARFEVFQRARPEGARPERQDRAGVDGLLRHWRVSCDGLYR